MKLKRFIEELKKFDENSNICIAVYVKGTRVAVPKYDFNFRFYEKDLKRGFECNVISIADIYFDEYWTGD